MRKGYLLFEIILVITLMSSVGIYLLFMHPMEENEQKNAVYEFQDALYYARSVKRNQRSAVVTVELEKNASGSYSYKVKSGGQIICTRTISSSVGVFTSKKGSGKFNPVAKLEFSIKERVGTESGKNLTVYFGNRGGDRIRFRVTIVPTSGRVFVYDES